jgi:hypothetical protein
VWVPALLDQTSPTQLLLALGLVGTCGTASLCSESYGAPGRRLSPPPDPLGRTRDRIVVAARHYPTQLIEPATLRFRQGSRPSLIRSYSPQRELAARSGSSHRDWMPTSSHQNSVGSRVVGLRLLMGILV